MASLEGSVERGAEHERPWLGQRVYRFLFRFLGPAQLGSEHEPETRPADDSFACPVCGRAMSEHTYVTTSVRRGIVCPAPPVEPRH